MKKTLKRAALIVATGAMLAGTAMTAEAALIENGQWCVENNGYWFKLTEDGSKFLANTWYWIKDSDGVIRCYYFDENGWLATNTTVDGETVNENGQWVKDGEVQTRSESDGGYDAHTDLSATKTTTTTTTTTTTASSTSKSSSSSTSTSTSKKTGSKAYKSSGQGDNPANATFTQGYENSTISGTTVTNSWANFTMTLSATPTKDTEGSGTDFYIDPEEGASLYVFYLPINKYGTSSLSGFVSGYLNDAHGAKGATQASDVALGGYTFKKLVEAHSDPNGNTYNDTTYIRSIDGTNYVMVIQVDSKNGSYSEDYLSSLKTMAKVR